MVTSRLIIFSTILISSLMFTSPGSAQQVDTRFDLCAEEEADVLRLYYALFNRKPDYKGGNYWVQQYRSGVELNDIAFWMSQGSEFNIRYGNIKSNSTLVDNFYRNIFKRNPDNTGKSYWVGQMDDGLKPHLTVRWMSKSPELAIRHPYKVRDCTPVQSPVSSNYYENCSEVWAKLGRPITRSDAGYRAGLDRDNDGTGCESKP